MIKLKRNNIPGINTEMWKSLEENETMPAADENTVPLLLVRNNQKRYKEKPYKIPGTGIRRKTREIVPQKQVDMIMANRVARKACYLRDSRLNPFLSED